VIRGRELSSPLNSPYRRYVPSNPFEGAGSLALAGSFGPPHPAKIVASAADMT
jgi:hypothetical protein